MMDIKAQEASEAVIVQGKLQSAHYLTSPRFRRGTFFVCTLTRRQSGDREKFTIIESHGPEETKVVTKTNKF
jgi:hypothetical protein